VRPDRALAYLRRYVVASDGDLREAAEQVTAGDLRLRRTADGSIARG
jgi:hypothetical protein